VILVVPKGRMPSKRVVQLSPRLNFETFEKSTLLKSVMFTIGGTVWHEARQNIIADITQAAKLLFIFKWPSFTGGIKSNTT
jgi:hypothetical protein